LIKEKIMENKTMAGIGISLIAGIILGGAIALLYAPESGKETRKMLRSKAMDARDYVEDLATETAEMVKEGVSEVNRKGHAAMQALKS
jgi:gas vesicle protein